MKDSFSEAYNKLNKEQKEAVNTIDGPVMVVAGPGTGKTQVLALRIANILKKTDTQAKDILCLTFTRAGVLAMKKRLRDYIGKAAGEVHVTTFHSFANTLVERHYEVLGFDNMPKLLDNNQSILLIDELLENNEWKHLRPRGDSTKYFSSIIGLISFLKRERITSEDFQYEIEKEITLIKEDPDNISGRGPTKGQLKKDVQNKIARLEKTSEVVSFYNEYEKLKKERGLMDYDDVLEYAVEIVEKNDSTRSDLQENYLYVHIDEHQDSSGVQNSFIKTVWQEVENPNIFVVGDDRQLIYGFSGANLSYFEEFKTAFGKAQIITLIENYRSTKTILSLADAVQKSQMIEGALRSNIKNDNLVSLNEYSYPRDEILAASIYFKDKINKGEKTEEMAIIVPKNRHVRNAISILKSQGVPVKAKTQISLFDITETDMLLRVLNVINNPFNKEDLSRSLFDNISGINPLDAHKFLHHVKTYKLSLDDLTNSEIESVKKWGQKISDWIILYSQISFDRFIQRVVNEALIDTSLEHEILMRRVEIARTFIEIVNAFLETNPKYNLQDLLFYIKRLIQYGQNINVAVIDGTEGIEVMTLHSSKGLEFKYVWIAHLNEGSLMSSKKDDFALPESIEARKETKNEEVVKREVYVGITRAKEYCTLSYAKNSITGKEDELAKIILDIPDEFFDKKLLADTEKGLLEYSKTIFVEEFPEVQKDRVEELKSFVKNVYTERNISVTSINNFYKCPWTWYFRNLVRLPEIKSESLYFGTALHAAVEAIINKSIDNIDKEIEEVMKNSLAKDGVTNQNEINRILREGLKVVKSWIQNYLPNISNIRYTEKSYSYNDPEFSHLNLYGKIDLVEEYDNRVIVTDFKTGSVKTSGAISKRDDEGRLSNYERQLAMYTYLLEANGKKNITSRLFFLEAEDSDKHKIYSTDIGAEEVQMLRKDIKDFDELIKDGNWINRQCNNKEFGGKECKYCEMAKKLYGVA